MIEISREGERLVPWKGNELSNFIVAGVHATGHPCELFLDLRSGAGIIKKKLAFEAGTVIQITDEGYISNWHALFISQSKKFHNLIYEVENSELLKAANSYTCQPLAMPYVCHLNFGADDDVFDLLSRSEPKILNVD